MTAVRSRPAVLFAEEWQPEQYRLMAGWGAAQNYVDTSRLLRDLTRAIDRFKTGNSRAPSLSPNLVALAREAWVVGSLEYGAAK